MPKPQFQCFHNLASSFTPLNPNPIFFLQIFGKFVYIKVTVSRDVLPLYFCSKASTCAPNKQAKTVLRIFFVFVYVCDVVNQGPTWVRSVKKK